MRAVKVKKLRARCLIAWDNFPAQYKVAISYKHFWRKFKKEYA